jgi:membrane protein required for colicin V production
MAYAAYGGYKKGLVIELVNTLGLLLAILAGFMLLDLGSTLLSPYFKGIGPMLPFVSFLIIFVTVIWSVRRLAQVARNTIRYTLFGAFDATAGACLGILKITFTISTLLWVIGLAGIKLPKKHTKGTYIYPVVANMGPASINLFGTLIPYLHDLPKALEKMAGANRHPSD